MYLAIYELTVIISKWFEWVNMTQKDNISSSITAIGKERIMELMKLELN